MVQLTKVDLRWIVSRLPQDVIRLLKEEGLFLGGGFIRSTIAGERPEDIDLFGTDSNKVERLARALSDSREGRFHKSDNAITILTGTRMPVQFITRWAFDSPANLMKSFDFTICQAVVWWAADLNCWMSSTHFDFYSDLAARRLVYTSPQREEDAGGSLLRVRKFLKRGYNIQAESLAFVVARLVKGVRNLESDMEEKELGCFLIGLLREVDPMTVIDGIEMVDEHA